MANATTPQSESQSSPLLRAKKILVSTDFSDNASQALPYANSYAQQFGAEVYLLHVIEKVSFMSDMKDVPLALSDAQVQQQTRNELDALAAKEFGEAVPIRTLVRQGKPPEEIVAAANELNVDLIIISTQGRTGLKRALLGSVAEKVIRHAPCPVLVVRQR
jgi:universal stress protein A